MTTMPPEATRVGLVVPGDCHVDDEFWRLLMPEAMPFVTRTRGASDTEMARDAVAETTSLAEGPEIHMAAERLADIGPAAVAYVDTSISFVRGRGGDDEIRDRLESVLGCPAITTSTAVIAALRALRVERMAVLSAYSPPLDERLADYYRAEGIETTSIRRLRHSYEGGTTSRRLGRLTPDELVADATAMELGDAGALFIPCTAVRTVGAIVPLERRLGIPVVTSIAATMWALLGVVGESARRPDDGALFEVAPRPTDTPTAVTTRG